VVAPVLFDRACPVAATDHIEQPTSVSPLSLVVSCTSGRSTVWCGHLVKWLVAQVADQPAGVWHVPETWGICIKVTIGKLMTDDQRLHLLARVKVNRMIKG